MDRVQVSHRVKNKASQQGVPKLCIKWNARNGQNLFKLKKTFISKSSMFIKHTITTCKYTDSTIETICKGGNKLQCLWNQVSPVCFNFLSELASNFGEGGEETLQRGLSPRCEPTCLVQMLLRA